MAETDRSVAGGRDQWVLFSRGTETRPLVIRARIGNAEVDRALVEDRMTIVECRAEAGLIDDRGFPTEMPLLYDFEEDLVAALESRKGKLFHVGSYTGEGARKILFTHSVPIDFGAVLTRFGLDGHALSSGEVTGRDAILALIKPTELELQLDGDNRVIDQLADHGDDGTAVRRVEFWFYGERDALMRLAGDLAGEGFEAGGTSPKEDGIVLFRDMAVDRETISAVTPMLLEAANRRGIRYDGWECQVVSEQPMRPGRLQ